MSPQSKLRWSGKPASVIRLLVLTTMPLGGSSTQGFSSKSRSPCQSLTASQPGAGIRPWLVLPGLAPRRRAGHLQRDRSRGRPCVTFCDGASRSRVASRAAADRMRACISSIAAPTERSSAVSAVQARLATWPGGVIAADPEVVAGDHRAVPGPAQLTVHRLGARAPRSPRRGSRTWRSPAASGTRPGRPGSASRCRGPGRRGSSRSGPSRGRRCGRSAPPAGRGWCAPITGPSARSSRASIQIDGAVSAEVRVGGEQRRAAGGAPAHRREGVRGAGQPGRAAPGRAGCAPPP